MLFSSRGYFFPQILFLFFQNAKKGDEELWEYLCENDQSNLDLSSNSVKEFTDEVSTDDLLDNKYFATKSVT